MIYYLFLLCIPFCSLYSMDTQRTSHNEESKEQDYFPYSLSPRNYNPSESTEKQQVNQHKKRSATQK